MSDKKLTLKSSSPGNFEPVLINTNASKTIDGVTTVTNGEIGIDDTGLLIIGNKATSLHKILNELLTGLAACSVSTFGFLMTKQVITAVSI